MSVHVPKVRVYVGTLVALLVLLALSVVTAQLGATRGSMWIGLAIAAAKALLVATIFMHLRWDTRTLLGVAMLAVLVLGAAFGLSFLDWGYREPVERSHAVLSSRLAARGVQ